MATTPAANGPPKASAYSPNPSRLRATVGIAVPTARASNASSETRATLPTVIARRRGEYRCAGGAAGAAVAVTGGPAYVLSTWAQASDLNPD